MLAILVEKGQITVGVSKYNSLNYRAKCVEENSVIIYCKMLERDIICEGTYSDLSLNGVEYDSAVAFVVAFNNLVFALDTLGYIEESIIDTTNVANGTYYPSSSGRTFGSYRNLSFTGKLIDGAGETTTLTLEATNDEDTTNADWIQVYGYDPKNNLAVNAHSVTNETKTFTWDFDDFNYKYFRLKITATAATNTVIIKMRRSI